MYDGKYTVNQILAQILFFCNLPVFEMNWFTVTNFYDWALAIPVFVLQLYGKYWFVARNICDNEAIANLQKISHMRIKIGLQYLMPQFDPVQPLPYPCFPMRSMSSDE